MKIIIQVAFMFLVSTAIAQEQFSFDEAISYAISHSDDIKVNELDIKNASAQITEYKAIGIPTVKGGLDYNYYVEIPTQPTQDFLTPTVYSILEEEGLAEPYTGQPETFNFSFFQPHNVTAKIEASSLLFDGSYLAGLKAAKVYKELQRKAIGITEQGIKANVSKAYLNVLIADERKEIIEKNLENISNLLYETEEVYKSGFVEKLDVDRLFLSQETLKTALGKTEQYIQLAKNLLKFQMNYPLNSAIELTEDLDLMVNKLKVTEVALEEPINFERRAELDQFSTAQDLNKLDMDRIQKMKLPSLFGFANYSQAVQRTKLFDSNETGLIPSSAVGLSVSVPIYDGGKRSGLYQQAKIRYEKTDIQLEQFKKGTTLQIMNSRIQYTNAKNTLANTEKVLEIITDIYDKTKIKFDEGVGSSVELNQAENALYEAQSSYINALYDLVNAKIDLEIATGNL